MYTSFFFFFWVVVGGNGPPLPHCSSAPASLATFGDEMIIAKTSPNWSCIMGPYFLAKSLKHRCGWKKISWCKFPIRGSFHGPGNNLWLWPLAKLLPINYQDKKEEEARKERKGGILEHFGTLIMKPYLRPWDLYS